MTGRTPGLNFIGYCRVSTKRQGESGLGLDAQDSAVRELVEREGGTLAGLYVEVESGKSDRNRPELQRAIAHAKRSRAKLIVAKLDRLSRDAEFLLKLQNSGLPIVCCDMPGANELTIGIMALVAQQERRMISRRTKDALAAAKRRGIRLGSSRPGHWKGREHRRRAGAKAGAVAAAEAHQRAADEAYTDLAGMMQDWRQEGRTLQQIADSLNDRGFATRRGKAWNKVQVSRVLQRQERIAGV